MSASRHELERSSRRVLDEVGKIVVLDPRLPALGDPGRFAAVATWATWLSAAVAAGVVDYGDALGAIRRETSR